MQLPQEILDCCGFTLFPYVAGGGRDSVRWAHEGAIAELRAGAAHPMRDIILLWARLAQEHEEAWQGLTDAEQNSVMTRNRNAAQPSASPAVLRYTEIEAELEEVYYEQLRAGELAKIRHALAELRAWLDGG
jgi:hypothetical protein